MMSTCGSVLFSSTEGQRLHHFRLNLLGGKLGAVADAARAACTYPFQSPARRRSPPPAPSPLAWANRPPARARWPAPGPLSARAQPAALPPAGVRLRLRLNRRCLLLGFLLPAMRSSTICLAAPSVASGAQQTAGDRRWSAPLLCPPGAVTSMPPATASVTAQTARHPAPCPLPPLVHFAITSQKYMRRTGRSCPQADKKPSLCLQKEGF